MDYFVGTSPKEPSQGPAHSKMKEKFNPTNKGGATSLAAAPLPPIAPAPSHSTSAPPPGATDMLDLSSIDPLQSQLLDQLTAVSGLTSMSTGNTGVGQQQEPQYFVPPHEQHQGFATAVGAFSQPATAALQTMGQQPASVVSMDSSSTTSSTQTQQYLPLHSAQVLLAPSLSSVPVFPASVISASTCGDKDEEDLVKKRPRNWEGMSADEKRRWERNMREQQRSHKISAQIKELRTLLTASNIPFKPSKYSILFSVSEYIKQLQSRAIMLDAEHKKLIETIRQTSEMVNENQTPEADTGAMGKEMQGTNVSSDADMLFVQGLDYRCVFEQSTTPLGVAALDGRILACNDEFEAILGYPKEELLKQSLFTVMQNHEEVFKAMGEMLKADVFSIDDLAGTKNEKPPLYWSGVVGQTNQYQLYGNISLVRSSDGSPKFFNCSLMKK